MSAGAGECRKEVAPNRAGWFVNSGSSREEIHVHAWWGDGVVDG